MFKVITKTNQNKGKYHKEPIRTQKSGEGEKQENWLRFTFRFSVIGFEGGESFLDQSQSKVKQNQSSPELVMTLYFDYLLCLRSRYVYIT